MKTYEQLKKDQRSLCEEAKFWLKMADTIPTAQDKYVILANRVQNAHKS